MTSPVTLNEIQIPITRRKRSVYPKLKNSGLDWLPKIPANWNLKRLRYAVSYPRKSEIREIPNDTPVSFIPMESVGEFGGLALDQIRPIEEVLNGYTFFAENDVIVAKITPCFENGKGALARGLENGIGFGTTELHVLRAGDGMLPEFLFYLTLGEHFRKLGTAEMYGASGQKRVPERFLKDIRHPIPPLDEQSAIASFLDRETARIDELIAKKGSLREALRTKRSSLVTRAVCQGLRSESLAASPITHFPKSWAVGKLRWYCLSIRDGTHNPPPRASGVFRLLSVRNVVDGRFILRDDDRTMDEDAFNELQRSYTVEKGDVVLAIVGATTGKSAVVEKIENVTVQRSLAILRPRQVLNSYFLNYWIQSKPLQTQIAETANKYAAQPGIYLDDVADLPVPIPTVSEQAEIVDFLDRKSAELQVLGRRVDQGIMKLGEYRAALVTAAVTGQIDVRNYRPEAPCH